MKVKWCLFYGLEVLLLTSLLRKATTLIDHELILQTDIPDGQTDNKQTD